MIYWYKLKTQSYDLYNCGSKVYSILVDSIIQDYLSYQLSLRMNTTNPGDI